MDSRRRLNSRARIITYAVLPIVFMAFLFITLTQDQVVSIIFAVGVSILLAIELVRAYVSKRKAGSGTLKDATASLSVAFITGIFNNLIILPIMYIFMGSIAMVTPLQLGDRINEVFGGQLSGWAILVSFAICIPLADFLYYWAHRSAHRVEIIWGSHSVHHSSEHFNPTTATRISFLDQAWDLVLMSAICLLGFNPIYALVSYALVLLYQLPLHQMWTGRLPAWYEFFFNTPVHHRAHHAYQRMYIDKNFGGITIIWDRIFGTFVEVDDSIPPEFGLTQKVDTYNPFRIMMAEFVHMGSSIKEMPNVRDRLQVPFRPPYWRPSDG